MFWFKKKLNLMSINCNVRIDDSPTINYNSLMKNSF